MPEEKQPALRSSPADLQVKLNFRVHPRMPSVYAHHMLVQPGQNEVLLSFFEVVPPLIAASGEPSGEQLRLLQETGVVAECVARITIAIASFPSFAKAMQDMLIHIPVPKDSQVEEDNAKNTRNNPES